MKSASKIDRILIDQVNNQLIDTDDQDVLIKEFGIWNAQNHTTNVKYVNFFTITLILLLTAVKVLLRQPVYHFSVVLTLLLNYVKFKYYLRNAKFSYVTIAINCLSLILVFVDWVFIVPIVNLGLYYYVFNVYEANTRSIGNLRGKRYKYKDV